MKKKPQRGFTLIELMIVVAIIGILASTAIPAYNNYTVRVKITEGMVLASSIRVGVSESFQDGNLAALDRYSTIIAREQDNLRSNMVSGFVVSPTIGTIVITYDTSATGIPQLIDANTLVYTPHINQSLLSATTSGTIQWECAGIEGANADLNSNNIATKGTIISRYLPSECR